MAVGSAPTPSDSDPAWPALSVFNGARSAVETYAAEAARIRSTSEFADADPQAKKFAALQSFARTLLDARAARYQPLLDRVAASIASNETALTAKGKVADSPRIASIWAHLDALDADDLQRAIDGAVRAGDVETIGAVLGAPRVFAFVKDTDRERITDAYLRRTDEAAYDRLTDMRASLSRLRAGAWTRAKSYISAVFGSPASSRPVGPVPSRTNSRRRPRQRACSTLCVSSFPGPAPERPDTESVDVARARFARLGYGNELDLIAGASREVCLALYADLTAEVSRPATRTV